MFSLALVRHDADFGSEDNARVQLQHLEETLRRRLNIKEQHLRSSGGDSPPWLLEAMRDQSDDVRVYSCPAVLPSRIIDSDEDDAGGSDVRDLKAEIAKLKEQNRTLQTQLKEAVSSVKTFHSQQRKLYDGFKILRAKYDDLKADSAVTMWEYIPSKIKGFEEVSESPGQRGENIFSRHATNYLLTLSPPPPPLLQLGDTNISVFESSTRIGDYTIGGLLGEGESESESQLFLG